MRLLVTVGTTQFAEMTDELQSKRFLNFLATCGVSEVIVQVGNAHIRHKELDIHARDYSDSNLLSALWEALPFYNGVLRVGITNFIPNLEQLIKSADLIISHCGAGTAMEALIHMKALCLVSNPNLSENHQIELGEALQAGEYASYIQGELLRDEIKEEFYFRVRKLTFRRFQ